MKQYECLVPGCPWHTQADNDARNALTELQGEFRLAG